MGNNETTNAGAQQTEQHTGGHELPEPYPLKFSPENVPPVISRNKWVTARYGLEGILIPKQRLLMQTEGGAVFAKAPVEMTAEMTVSEFYAFDFNGHKSYRTLDHCVSALQGYYPRSTLTERSMLDIVSWDPEKLEIHPRFRERTGTVAVSETLRQQGGMDV